MSYLNPEGWPQPCDRLRYIGRSAPETDLEDARRRGLVVGDVYEVTRCEVGSSWSTVELAGKVGPFNAIMFERMDGRRVGLE